MLLFLTFSALVAKPKKTTLHGGQSRSWSAEQGKIGKKKSGICYCRSIHVRNTNIHIQSLSKNCTGRESVSVLSPLSRLIRGFRNKYQGIIDPPLGGLGRINASGI